MQFLESVNFQYFVSKVTEKNNTWLKYGVEDGET